MIQSRLAQLADVQHALPLPYSSLALSKAGTMSYLEGEMVLVDAKGPYLVGALARLNVNDKISTPRANEALTAYLAKGKPRLSALDYLAARLVEMIHNAERMVETAEKELTGGPIKVEAAARQGRYIGVVEAPRGILIHDYTADAQGRIADANLIVATQNNYDAIDSAIASAARHFLPRQDRNLLMNILEFALRCFDPCLSCATRVAGRMPMEVVLTRNGEVVRTIERKVP